MTYKQTIDFLFNTLPMYQRVGDSAIKKDLTNITKLCDLLNQPQRQYDTIHIAGTNGKGSTSHMLASIFQAAGKKVGLYTSPHYIDFRERIKVNGQMIGQKEVIQFVQKYKEVWQDIQPSFFEITLVMAFDYFRKEDVEIAIIETGLGGRLDSTNIVQPLLTIITNIGYDHMQMLGNTLPKIAKEKAGIIKKGVPVVIGEWQKETNEVFQRRATELGSTIHFASRHIFLKGSKEVLDHHKYIVKTRSVSWLGTIQSDLEGPYQKKNIRTVLEACWVWNKYYPDQLLRNLAIKKGIGNTRKNTNMIGRWMKIRENPYVIADAAHNLDGINSILPGLLKIPAEKRHFVLGFVGDKDVNKILSMFPKTGLYYWCAPAIPRKKPQMDTLRVGAGLGLSGKAYTSVIKAFNGALKNAGKRDLIFIGGSSYVVGDFLTEQG